ADPPVLRGTFPLPSAAAAEAADADHLRHLAADPADGDRLLPRPPARSHRLARQEAFLRGHPARRLLPPPEPEADGAPPDAGAAVPAPGPRQAERGRLG